MGTARALPGPVIAIFACRWGIIRFSVRQPDFEDGPARAAARRLRVLTIHVSILILIVVAACNRNPQPGPSVDPGRKFASESTAALLDRWCPTEQHAGESNVSGEIGYELQSRMAGRQMNEADSQRYIDNLIKHDLNGVRWQMTRTAAVWPLDGRAFVRAVTVYPVSSTALRWRRDGETGWCSVAHYGRFAFLDLGRPSKGKQTVRIEYEIKSHMKTVWQGALDVTYEGRGAIADTCELVRDPTTDDWLRKATRGMLRGGWLKLFAPYAEESPSGLHIAGQVELIRDGAPVGRTYAIFGRGRPRNSCGSLGRRDSVEWLTPDGPLDSHKFKWTMRLTSIPELAATGEFFDSQVEDPPPRRVWVGSVEMSLDADSRKVVR